MTTLSTDDRVRERLLAGFQRELLPFGWLRRKLSGGNPPAIGYVLEYAKACIPGQPEPEILRSWRITATTVEPLPPNSPFPEPTVVSGMFSDIAYFTFSLPDDSGCGTQSSQLGPRYGSGFRYRPIIDGGTTEIQPEEQLWVS